MEEAQSRATEDSEVLGSVTGSGGLPRTLYSEWQGVCLRCEWKPGGEPDGGDG
jgi:hypothetical protein